MTASVLRIYFLFAFVQFCKCASPLTEYIEVPERYVAPIPANSLKIEKGLSLDMCAAKCTLEFRMKTFPCYAFEYTPGSQMCVHTNITSLVVGGGYLGMKKNQAVSYYERTKAAYSNLFHGQNGMALQDQKAYFEINLNRTLEQCAFECASSMQKTCMSFSFSPRSGACGLSSAFYNNGENHVNIVPTELYNHYQYYTSWPCNATLRENYGPRALASVHFPYQSIQNVDCYAILTAPPGKQVLITFPTVFFGANICSHLDLGLMVNDGTSGSGPRLGRLCYTNADRAHPPTFTSTNGSLYIHYKVNTDAVAFQSVYNYVHVDPCAVNSCQHGSTCRQTNFNTSYTCDCLLGYGGRYCEINVDDCQSSPCYFNGLCIDQLNGFSCNCTEEFTGSRCETFVGACAKNPCQHGKCVITSRYNYTCRCGEGFTGQKCDQPITPCMRNPCKHGECHNTQNGYICKCSNGYHGDNCDQLSFDICSLNPCKNGICRSSGFQFVCTCAAGYSGQYCDVVVDPCVKVNCNHGHCIRHELSYVCHCQPGYNGQFCNEQIPICQMVNCGDGHCYPYTNIAEGYVCYCSDGKYRKYCNTSEVTSSTLLITTSTPASDPCASSPCENGQCNVTQTGYICQCQYGYTGTNCEKTTCDVADCGLGLCVDNDHGFKCICPVGYEGTNCKSLITTPASIVDCSSFPCKNNGTCVNITSGTFGFLCKCPFGTIGERCDVADLCASSPCKHGICEQHESIFRCVVTTLFGHSNVTAAYISPTTTDASIPGGSTTSPITRSDITCNGDDISVYVPMDLLPMGRSVTWRDPDCAITNNGTHYVGTVDFNHCGTTVRFNDDSVEFRNELISHSSNHHDTPANAVIDFGDGFDSVVPVECVYPRKENAMASYLPVQGQVRFFEKRMGHLDLELQQVEDQTFTVPVAQGSFPPRVHLNNNFYIKVSSNHMNRSDVGIHLDNCVATPSASPADSTFQPLIKNGCPSMPSVTVYQSPVTEARVGIRAFQFSSHPAQTVYIHCEVSVCPVTDSQCTAGCVASSRQRRAAEPGQKRTSHLLSAGPYILMAEEGSVQVATVVAGICGCIAIVATTFAVVMWRKQRELAAKTILE